MKETAKCCPLLSAAKGGTGYAICVGECCAWYDTYRKECAAYGLYRELTIIRGTIGKMEDTAE